MSTIDHAAEARGLLALSHDYEMAHSTSPTPEEALLVCAAVSNGYAAAQVHATLALVEQQRIANLIAFASANGYDPSFHADVKKGLGL